MSSATNAYDDRNSSGAQARSLEASAFVYVNRLLENIADDRERMVALGRNQRLWSMLIKDIALDSNGLPPILKSDLVNIGRWSMQYSIDAMGAAMPLEPLIAINRDMIDGLRAHVASPPGPPVAGRTAAPLVCSA